MSTPQEAKRVFSRILHKRDGEISLIGAALAISAAQGNEAPAELCLAKISAFAHRVQAHLLAVGITEARTAPRAAIRAINKVLFEEEGFTGNARNYYDLHNSSIPAVLERRAGIPITLSIIYMEVARQVGLTLEGIGLPGHFVVGYWPSRNVRLPALVIDPYHHGKLLTLEDCAARVHAVYGADVRFTIEWVQPLSRRQILARMLGNLKQVYLASRQYSEALRVVDLLLLVQPDAIWELKDRGLLHYRTGEFGAALADLKRYMKWAPATDDNPQLKYYIAMLQRLAASRN